MTLQWKLSIQAGICAAAVLGTGWAQAQSTAPNSPQHPSQPMPAQSAPMPQQYQQPMLSAPQQPAQASQPHHAEPKPAKKAHKPAHKSSAGKYASPEQHEAAAVGHERRQGKGPHNPANADQMGELQRNALRRCEVFKTNEDRMACVERVRQPQISGSVEGGGLIREYTQTVRVDGGPRPSADTVRPVNPAMQPGQQYQAPQPQPHPHLVHPPVQPIRPQ